MKAEVLMANMEYEGKHFSLPHLCLSPPINSCILGQSSCLEVWKERTHWVPCTKVGLGQGGLKLTRNCYVEEFGCEQGSDTVSLIPQGLGWHVGDSEFPIAQAGECVLKY